MSEIGICDTTKDVVLQGAVWLQEGKPDKVRYAIIEKEMLEIVCEYLDTTTIYMAKGQYTNQTISHCLQDNPSSK